MNHLQKLLLRAAVLVHQGDLVQIQPLDKSLVYRGLDLLLYFLRDRSRGPHNGRYDPAARAQTRIGHTETLEPSTARITVTSTRQNAFLPAPEATRRRHPPG